jgi:hypothetical protein
MKIITPAFRQGAGYESFLTQQGFVLDDEPAAEKPKAKPKPKAKKEPEKKIAAETAEERQ